MNLSMTSRVIVAILGLFNLFSLVLGIIIITIGGILKAHFSEYDIFLSENFFTLPNLIIAIGCLTFLISFVGWCGAMRNGWVTIFVFAILLSAIFIMELSAGIAGYELQGSTKSYLEGEMSKSMPRYKTNQITRQSWDDMQKGSECCGAAGPEDWKGYFNSTPEVGIGLPLSCCKPQHGRVSYMVCATNSTNAEVFTTGCIEAVGNILMGHAGTIGAVGLTIAFIQLLGIILAFHLARQLRRGYYYSTD